MIDQVGKPIGFRIQIGMINLVDVSGNHDLHGVAGARDDGFDFVRREVLGFIDNEEDLSADFGRGYSSAVR